MASKITRVVQKQFGVNGPSGEFGVFGSKANPPQTFSQDPETIQSLTAFLSGWGSAIVGNYQPPMEDMNSLFLLAFRQLAYIFQEGIPEWNADTTYYSGSLVKLSGVIYNSLINDNVGNNPTTDSGVKWQQGFGGINGGVPTGTILPFGGLSTNVPAGYLLGDGSAISRTTYSSLFAVYGTLYGAGNGTTTFNLPNGKGRVLVGADGTSEFLTPGTIGGEKAHTLTTPEMPNHIHRTPAGQNGAGSLQGSQAWSSGATQYGAYGDSEATGGGQSHNNLQPYLVVGGIIIKY